LHEQVGHSLLARDAIPDGDQAVGLVIRRGRSSTACVMLKTAVFAPIPMARVRAATALKPGDRRIVRSASRTSRRTSSIQAGGEPV
jgi:hypothetical protein